MAYTLCPYEERQYFDDEGEPLAFGKVNTYLSGTTTPVFTFADSTGTLNSNPVVLSASGRCRIYLDPLLAYRFIVTDANDVPVGLTMDPVSLNLAALAAQSFLGSTRGSVAAPVFSFVADPDTGIYSSAVNTLDVATGGAQRVRFHPTGGVGIGDVTDPGALNLRVAGAIYLVGSAAVTTNALENRGGSLYFNNVALATGGSLSGTTGKLAKFTGSSTVGDSIVSESGTTVTVAGTAAATTFSGSGASLTALPAGQLSGTIPAATQDLMTRLGTIVSGIWNAGAVTSSGTIKTTGGVVQSQPTTATAAGYLQVINTGGQFFAGLDSSTGGSFGFGNYGGLVYSSTVVGMAIVAADAAGTVRIITGGSTQRAQYAANGNYILGSGTNITDAVATPTVASHDGTDVTVAGKSYAFRLTMNSSGTVVTTCTINFGATYASAPVCVASRASTADRMGLTSSTTQVVITAESGFNDGEVVQVIVRGY